MSQDAIHVVITAGFIGLMFAWVPIVGVLCPSVWRTSEGMSSQREEQLASGNGNDFCGFSLIAALCGPVTRFS